MNTHNCDHVRGICLNPQGRRLEPRKTQQERLQEENESLRADNDELHNIAEQATQRVMDALTEVERLRAACDYARDILIDQGWDFGALGSDDKGFEEERVLAPAAYEV